jgi:hypothetical protein
MVAMLESKSPEICLSTMCGAASERLYGTNYSVPRLFETDLIHCKSPSDLEPSWVTTRWQAAPSIQICSKVLPSKFDILSGTTYL